MPLDVGLIDEPAVTNRVSARSRSFDHLWGEPLHPSVDGHVMEIPAHGQQDHLRWEPVARERGGLNRATVIHEDTITKTTSSVDGNSALSFGSWQCGTLTIRRVSCYRNRDHNLAQSVTFGLKYQVLVSPPRKVAGPSIVFTFESPVGGPPSVTRLSR